jgi:hypothetical protein
VSEAKSINPCYLDRGTRIGAYEVLDQIDARGAFGCVWKVRRDGRVYALKLGKQRPTGLDSEDRLHYEERLDREIAALKTLRHPNIVRVHTFDWWPRLDDGFPYLVMDFVDGLPLYAWQEDAVPSLARICGVFEKLAATLQHMHDLGVYHRDLKSENVLVRSADGEPVVVDFGIARPQIALNVTQAATVGTITHYAPEYARYVDSAAFSRGEPFDWKPTTDLHAVGYMLYDLLTGQPPYPYEVSPPTSEAKLLLSIKNDLPPRPSELNPRVPVALSDIAMALLEKDPSKRPQSGGVLATMLVEAREAASAAGDRSWADPFDLPGRGGKKVRGEAEDENEELVDVAPPLERNDGEAAGAAEQQNMAPRDAPVLNAAARSGVPSFDAPVPAPQPPFDSGERGEDAPVASPPADPLSGVVLEAKARLAASAPRRGPGRLAIAAGVLVVGVVGVLLIAAMMEPEETRPRSLLSENEPRTRDAFPAGSQSTSGAPAPTSEPQGAEERPSPSDARAIDEALAREFGRPTVLPDGRLVMRPAPTGQRSPPAREASSVTASDSGASASDEARDPPWLHRSTRLASTVAKAPSEAKPLGVPIGTHMKAKLLTNLDSRTIGSGPVEAILTAPVAVRGEIVLPARTLAFGTASESSGRFSVRFTHLRLPDDTEVEFEGLALARDDGKPGLAAARRIQREQERQPGLGSKIAKGTGNILLDTIAGGVRQDVARGAGQAVLNHEQPAAGGSEWALLLDGGVVFDIWVERAF